MEKPEKKPKFGGDLSLMTTTIVALLLVVFHEHTNRDTFKSSDKGARRISSTHTEQKTFPMDILNKGLQNLHSEREIHRERAKMERELRPRDMDQQQYLDVEQVKREGQQYGLQLNPHNPAEEIARQNKNPVRMDYNQLDTAVSRNLAAQEALAQYEQEYRKEYIKQFLENARRDGYEIILNDDLSIKEVREVKR
ncbi:MAG: hypothetical protein R2827_00825 [Bdellovibrionales bacterium]